MISILTFLQKKHYGNKGKEDASISKEDNKVDSSNSNADEVAQDDDHCEQQQQPESVVLEVVDPDFYDFSRDRSEECFEIDQMWAVYKDFDGMPRFYARIDKVYSPFKVDVTWLEFIAANVDETAWKRSGLPVACGKFKHGKTDTIEHIRAFSHKIFWSKIVGHSCNIYPEKGEIWALYKNWNIEWSSDQHNHREYVYEFVEVLTDYTKESGILVAHLVKLEGFECLFQPTKNNDTACFQIPSNEILRFSHRVPSYRTNGKERQDVPAGCFELDPCSLPSHREDTESEPSTNNGKGEASISVEDEKSDSSNRIVEEVAEHYYHYEQQPESEVVEVAVPDFYDFDWDKSVECFAVDQIWALYDCLDSMPRFYARINRIYSPFKVVDVTWLEFTSKDIDETAWKRSGLPVACGDFKQQKTATVEYMGRFSHRIFWKKSVNNSYKIYPQKGETWALYKNWGIKWSSDPDNHREYEYELVVVLSDYTSESGIVVIYLVKLKGFVCLFKPTRINGMVSFQIPSNEMLRFSHRVPSFKTNGKEREDVPEGYFELDPCSLPSNLEEVSEYSDVESETADGIFNGSLNSVSKEKHAMHNKGKEDASISKENKRTDSSNRIAEEVSEQQPESVVHFVANPDFYDFDGDKGEECFAFDQMWAIYDDIDGMPRFYAWINKVYSPFKVDVTWLEFIAGDIDETAWKRSGLPVACGKFKYEKTDTIDDIGTFSHKIFQKRSVNKSYNIYPQKGETWALYKNWNLKWSSDPDNHREYEYEFVVVLSDYSKQSGISVSHLVKLEGFVCLFKPTKKNGMASFQIPSSEMLRFSHMVPSFRTNGEEQEDIPEGYFELDTCSLPSNLEEMSENVDGYISGSLKFVSKEKHPMSKKRKTLHEESILDGISAGGNKSFRISNGRYENLHEEKRAAEAKKNAAAHAKEMSLDGVITIPGSFYKDTPSSPSCLKIFEMLDTEFCNFNKERSCEKYKTGQIWALYCKLDKLPKTYARIESVESFPVFKLAIKWLKSCDPPRDIISWVDKEMPVSCGTFKVTSSEVVVFNDSILFSHELSEVPAVNNVFTIYPRAGEVWALYSKCSSDLTCSDLKKCEYNIVEVLEVVDVHWIIVSVLQRVTGYKAVFEAKQKEGLGSAVAIPWIELYRFSHQVPSFALSGARYGKLRGCWELDYRALAVYSHSVN